MYKDDRFKGLILCTKEEFEDKTVEDKLIATGYQHLHVVSPHTSDNVTDYFYSDIKPFVFARCYFANKDIYAEFIISKKVANDMGLLDVDAKIKPMIKINAWREGSFILYVRYADNLFTSVRGKKCRSAVNKYTIYNIIDDGSIFTYTDELKKSELLFPASARHSISFESGLMGYHLSIVDLISPNNSIVDSLNADGFKVRLTSAYFYSIDKWFSSEYYAVKAASEYQNKYYGELKPDFVKEYLSENFSKAISYLIFNDLSLRDIEEQALQAHKDDWRFICERNLEEVYEAFGIKYKHCKTGDNGELIEGDEE